METCPSLWKRALNETEIAQLAQCREGEVSPSGVLQASQLEPRAVSVEDEDPGLDFCTSGSMGRACFQGQYHIERF